MLCFFITPAALLSQELRLALLGTDSTHAVQFTRILNGTEKDHIAGAKITVAYRGGSPSLAISRDRIDGITSTLQSTWNIPFVHTIRELCKNTDGILLLSVDARLRMQEVREAATCGKPIFIDKPLAASRADAEKIAAFLDSRNVPWFSASSIRFGYEPRPAILIGAEAWGSIKYIDEFPLDLSYYGVHSIECLYSLMGSGVSWVSRVRSNNSELLTAQWGDGRIGSIRLLHSNATYGATLYRNDGNVDLLPIEGGYSPQVQAIVNFVRSGKAPVPEAETLEIFSFMEAAQQSLRLGGDKVHLTNTPRSQQ
jgi:predicted dehydrogenase